MRNKNPDTNVTSRVPHPVLKNVHLYCFSAGRYLGDRNPVEIVAAQIKGGADVIQLREKEMSVKERLELGRALREVTRRAAIPFIVNDDVDLALILGADGVHLGQDDIPIEHARPLMKNRIIGVSTHSLAQVESAVASGADYIGVGPVFETRTKEDREALVGLDLLSKVRDICPIPYVAIGGIGKETVGLLSGVGCHRAAIISDIMLSSDIEECCRVLKRGLL